MTDPATPVEDRDRPVTPDSVAELERQLRDLLGPNGGGIKRAAVAAGAGVLALGVVSVYLLGRRKGRRRASVLEIRRV